MPMNMLSNRILALYRLFRHPYMKREQITQFQNRQLRLIIHYAYHNVPYYRRLFKKANLRPQDINTTEDLDAIPITSKKDLQTIPAEDFLSTGMDSKNLIVRRTGGSTGEPTVIRRSWFEEILLQAFQHRALHYYGRRFKDHSVKVLAISDQKNHTNKSVRFIQQFIKKYGFLNVSFVDCRLPVEDIISKIKNLNPDTLGGYPGAIHYISRSLSEDDKEVIRPRILTVGGEVLTPLMRQQISDSFGAPVYSVYNSNEFYNISWECKETGQFHVCDDSLIMEVLKDNRQAKEGETGEVVGTCLHSFAMPLIRFRLGDVVTKGAPTCQCGLPFSTISQIQGRMTDHFLLPNGQLLHPWVLLDGVYTASWIRQYRLIQERVDRIVLNVVPLKNAPEQELKSIEDIARKTLGDSVEFKIKFVPEIPFEPNGKFRVSKSLVDHNPFSK